MTAAMATEMPVQIKSMAMLSNAKSVQLAPRFMTTRTTDASAMATPDTQTMTRRGPSCRTNKSAAATMRGNTTRKPISPKLNSIQDPPNLIYRPLRSLIFSAVRRDPSDPVPYHSKGGAGNRASFPRLMSNTR